MEGFDGMQRWIPWLMIIGAVLHIVSGLAVDPPWQGIVADGVINTVDGADRTSAMWFLTTGLAFLCLSLVTRRLVQQTGQVPYEAGWGVFGIGLLVVLLRPLDGGWVALVIGLITLVAAFLGRRRKTAADTAG